MLKNEQEISIHTPVKGVTVLGILVNTLNTCISIHTPVKGVTIVLGQCEKFFIIFQSTLP